MVNVLKGHAQMTNTSCKIHGNIQEMKYTSSRYIKYLTKLKISEVSNKIVAGDILKFSLFRSLPSTPNSWLSMPSTLKLALLKLTCQKSEWENGRAQTWREGKSAYRFSRSITNPFAFGFWLHDLSVTHGQASDEGG